MATLVHPSLTNCQAFSGPSGVATTRQPGLFARLTATLETWRRRSTELRELARMTDRELRDLGLSSADVWHEIRHPVWRATRPDRRAFRTTTQVRSQL